MTECEYCQIAENKLNAKKIYEDKEIIAALSQEPASLGHIIIFPKKHYPIIENIPDYEVARIFQIANMISSIAFEVLKMQGTNIIVNNGVAAGQEKAHFCIHIIPRREGDNLNFNWQPKQLDEEKMSTIELKIKDETKNIGEFEKEKQEPQKIDAERKKIPVDSSNHLIKQIKRIP